MEASSEAACQCRRRHRLRFDPWVRKIPWRKWQPTSVFLPGKLHRQRSLAASLGACIELDMTEHASPRLSPWPSSLRYSDNLTGHLVCRHLETHVWNVWLWAFDGGWPHFGIKPYPTWATYPEFIRFDPNDFLLSLPISFPEMWKIFHPGGNTTTPKVEKHKGTGLEPWETHRVLG